MKLGAHMSTSGGVWKALERGRSIGCEAVQIFVKSNMRWMGTAHSAKDVGLFAAERKAGVFSCVFAHAGYLINLAAPAGEIREHSLRSLVQEIEFATALELPYLVMHPGAHVGQGEKAGFKQVIAGLDEVCRITKRSSVRIALENTAGQGSCLGHRFEHLAEIFSGVKKPERLAVCLDTCHLFAAGYDIRTRNGWDAAMEEMDSLVGLEQVVAFHLNDSKTDLGSRVDRHAHIGEGKIGLEGFRHVVNDGRFREHPGCLETPKSDDLREDVKNLAVLRGLIAGKNLKHSKFETPAFAQKLQNPKRQKHPEED
jgi:deoxyribonuclease-4